MEKIKYEAWDSEEDGVIAFAPADAMAREKDRGQLGKNAKLLYTFEAATFEEALAVHHIRMGWEPFKPMGDSEKCPNKCGALYYPRGSSQCWNCGFIE